MKSPKYLLDSSEEEDFFSTHSNIAKTIANIIKEEDLHKHSFVMGLFGQWGTGKSLIIKTLKKQLIENENIIFLELDIWKYIGASLYRSILFDLEKQLKEYANNTQNKVKIVNEKFRNGYENLSKESLDDLLNLGLEKHIETPLVYEQDYIENSLGNIKKIKLRNSLLYIYRFIKTPIVALYAVGYYAWKRRVSLFILIVALFCIGYFFNSLNSIKSTFILKYIPIPALKFIGYSIIGVASLDFLKKFFEDFFNELKPKSSIRITSSPPTFAQDQFESIFNNIIDTLSDNGKNKIIIVFDNIDRCDQEIAYKALTGLKTFMDIPNCFYIIPCDDQQIRSSVGYGIESENNADGILDKIFRTYIRIPLLQGVDKDSFISDCIKKSEFNFSNDIISEIEQILYFAYRGDTPREIKRFFNDFISYYHLAIQIDKKKEFLLRDISFFTIMVMIKQKWPFFENELIKNPEFFSEFKLIRKSLNTGNKSLDAFLNNILEYVNSETNALQFIYLKNIDQNYIQIKDWLLSDDIDLSIPITIPLVKEIDKTIQLFIHKNNKSFITKSLSNILIILNNEFSNDEFISPYLLLYRKFIEYIIQLDNNNQVKEYILERKAEFKKIIQAKKQLKNNEPLFTQLIIDIINKNKSKSESKELYKFILPFLKSNELDSIFYMPDSLESIDLFYLEEYLKIEGTTYFPSDYVNNLINKSSESFYPELAVLLENIGQVRAANVAYTLSKKIHDILTELKNQDPIEKVDNFCIQALKFIDLGSVTNNQYFDIERLSFIRAKELLNYERYDLAISYAREVLLKGTETSVTDELNHNLAADNEQYSLGNNPAFQALLDSLSIVEIVLLLKKERHLPVFVDQIEKKNAWKTIIEKIPNDRLLEDFSKIKNKSINFLKSILYKSNDIRSYNSELSNTIENKVVEYITSFKDDNILPYLSEISEQIIQNSQREIILNEALVYYSRDFAKNISNIETILENLNLNKSIDIINQHYLDLKIKIISNITLKLYKLLSNNLSLENLLDLHDRLLPIINSRLKSNQYDVDILNAVLFESDLHSLISNQQLLSILKGINIELLEISRDDDENMIGVRFYERLSQTDTNIKKALRTLADHETKSEELKTKITKILE